jgi:hypothetical protein
MTCAFFAVLMLLGGIISLMYVAWSRVRNHLQDQSEATKMFVEHVVAPMLLGERKDDKQSEV